MPTFEVELDNGETYEIEADNEPTHDEIYSALGVKPDTGRSRVESFFQKIPQTIVGDVVGGVAGLPGALLSINPAWKDNPLRVDDDIKRFAEEAFPTNPAFEGSGEQDVASAVGQGIGMILPLGAASKLGAGAKALQAGGLSMAGAMGATGGANTADLYGAETFGERLSHIAGGAARETLTEMIGGVGAGGFSRALAGDIKQVLKGQVGRQVAGTVGSEMFEEVVSGAIEPIQTRLTTSGLEGLDPLVTEAPNGQKLPNLPYTWEGVKDVAWQGLMGGVGGTVFAIPQYAALKTTPKLSQAVPLYLESKRHIDELTAEGKEIPADLAESHAQVEAYVQANGAKDAVKYAATLKKFSDPNTSEEQRAALGLLLDLYEANGLNLKPEEVPEFREKILSNPDLESDISDAISVAGYVTAEDDPTTAPIEGLNDSTSQLNSNPLVQAASPLTPTRLQAKIDAQKAAEKSAQVEQTMATAAAVGPATLDALKEAGADIASPVEDIDESTPAPASPSVTTAPSEGIMPTAEIVESKGENVKDKSGQRGRITEEKDGALTIEWADGTTTTTTEAELGSRSTNKKSTRKNQVTIMQVGTGVAVIYEDENGNQQNIFQAAAREGTGGFDAAFKKAEEAARRKSEEKGLAGYFDENGKLTKVGSTVPAATPAAPAPIVAPVAAAPAPIVAPVAAAPAPVTPPSTPVARGVGPTARSVFRVPSSGPALETTKTGARKILRAIYGAKARGVTEGTGAGQVTFTTAAEYAETLPEEERAEFEGSATEAIMHGKRGHITVFTDRVHITNREVAQARSRGVTPQAFALARLLAHEGTHPLTAAIQQQRQFVDGLSAEEKTAWERANPEMAGLLNEYDEIAKDFLADWGKVYDTFLRAPTLRGDLLGRVKERKAAEEKRLQAEFDNATSAIEKASAKARLGDTQSIIDSILKEETSNQLTGLSRKDVNHLIDEFISVMVEGDIAAFDKALAKDTSILGRIWAMVKKFFNVGMGRKADAEVNLSEIGDFMRRVQNTMASRVTTRENTPAPEPKVEEPDVTPPKETPGTRLSTPALAPDKISTVSIENDEHRVGTSKLGTEAKPIPTPQTSNISGDIVPNDILSEHMDVMGYPHLPKDIRSDRSYRRKHRKMVEWMKSNLRALYDAFPAEFRARATHWYDGANRLAIEFAGKYGTTMPQAAGVMAVLSPQKDWFMNVAQAWQVMDAWKNHQDTVLSEEMIRTEMEDIIEAATAPKRQLKSAFKGETPEQVEERRKFNNDLKKKAQDNRRAVLEQIVGKTIKALDDTPELQGWAIRVLAQTVYGRNYHVLAPEGDFMDLQRNNPKKGKTVGEISKNGWGSIGEIEKAVNILKDGSLDMISSQLGNEHKVRNFYNNIVAPNSPHGDATIDTHAVAAAHLMPFGASALEVKHNFGGSGARSSGPLGISGTYHVYIDAYRELAEDLGLQPRQLQSITWEAVRLLFPAAEKDKTAVAEAVKQWHIGDTNEARDRIVGRRLPPPAWAGASGGGESQADTKPVRREGEQDVPSGSVRDGGGTTPRAGKRVKTDGTRASTPRQPDDVSDLLGKADPVTGADTIIAGRRVTPAESLANYERLHEVGRPGADVADALRLTLGNWDSHVAIYSEWLESRGFEPIDTEDMFTGKFSRDERSGDIIFRPNDRKKNKWTIVGDGTEGIVLESADHPGVVYKIYVPRDWKGKDGKPPARQWGVTAAVSPVKGTDTLIQTGGNITAPLEKARLVSGIGGIPQEFHGIDPATGAIVIKMPRATGLPDEADILGLLLQQAYPGGRFPTDTSKEFRRIEAQVGKEINKIFDRVIKSHGLLEFTGKDGVPVWDALKGQTFITSLEHTPYFVTDIRVGNLIIDNQSEPRIVDAIVRPIARKLYQGNEAFQNKVDEAIDLEDTLKTRSATRFSTPKPTSKQVKAYEDEISSAEEEGPARNRSGRGSNLRTRRGDGAGSSRRIPDAAGAPKEWAGRTVTLTHWSGFGDLESTDPAKHGTGGIGAEKQRKTEYAKHYQPRTYFGYGSYRREPFIGGERYTTEIDGSLIYDFSSDPLGLWPDADELKAAGYARFDDKAKNTIFERKIKEAGYSGYRSKSYSVVALFEPAELTKVANSNRSEKAIPSESRSSTPRAGSLSTVIRENKDGFTVSFKGEMPDGGFAVAPSKETEFFLPPDFTEDMLEDYLGQHEELAALDGAHLGGWFDKQANRYTLDISFVLEERDDALRVAKWADQDAIFDLNTFNEIRTPADFDAGPAPGSVPLFAQARRRVKRGVGQEGREENVRGSEDAPAGDEVEGSEEGLRASTPAPPTGAQRLKGDARNSVSDDVWYIFQKSYGDIGNPYANKAELMAQPESWDVVMDDKGRPVAFFTLKETADGGKLTSFGTDSSTDGKTTFKRLFKDYLTTPGYYSELSGVPEIMARKYGIPAVPSSLAPDILNKPVKVVDEERYERLITGLSEPHTKTMFGLPWKTQTNESSTKQSRPSSERTSLTTNGQTSARSSETLPQDDSSRSRASTPLPAASNRYDRTKWTDDDLAEWMKDAHAHRYNELVEFANVMGTRTQTKYLREGIAVMADFARKELTGLTEDGSDVTRVNPITGLTEALPPLDEEHVIEYIKLAKKLLSNKTFARKFQERFQKYHAETVEAQVRKRKVTSAIDTETGQMERTTDEWLQNEDYAIHKGSAVVAVLQLELMNIAQRLALSLDVTGKKPGSPEFNREMKKMELSQMLMPAANDTIIGDYMTMRDAARALNVRSLAVQGQGYWRAIKLIDRARREAARTTGKREGMTVQQVDALIDSLSTNLSIPSLFAHSDNAELFKEIEELIADAQNSAESQAAAEEAEEDDWWKAAAKTFSDDEQALLEEFRLLMEDIARDAAIIGETAPFDDDVKTSTPLPGDEVDHKKIKAGLKQKRAKAMGLLKKFFVLHEKNEVRAAKALRKKILEDKRIELLKPDPQARKLINEYVNGPVVRSSAKPKNNPLREAFIKQVRSPASEDDFVDTLTKMGVDEQTAYNLASVANDKIEERKEKQARRDEAKLTKVQAKKALSRMRKLQKDIESAAQEAKDHEEKIRITQEKIAARIQEQKRKAAIKAATAEEAKAQKELEREDAARQKVLQDALDKATAAIERSKKELAKLARLPTDIAEAIIDELDEEQTEWIGHGTKQQHIVRRLKKAAIMDARTDPGVPGHLSKERFVAHYRSALIEAKVNAVVAHALANRLYDENRKLAGNAELRKTARMLNSRAFLEALIKDIYDTPIGAKGAGTYAQDQAVAAFRAAGLTEEKAKNAADMLQRTVQKVQQKAQIEAIERAAKKLKMRNPTIESLKQAIRSGLLNPADPIASTLARLSGFKELSLDDYKQLAEADEMTRGTSSEQAKGQALMLQIIRKSDPPKAILDMMFSSWVPNAISGSSNYMLNLTSPLFSIFRNNMVRSVEIMTDAVKGKTNFTQTAARLGALLTSFNRGMRETVDQMRFAAKHDAYKNRMAEHVRNMDALIGQSEKAVEMLKTGLALKDPVKILGGATRWIYSTVNLIRRSFSTIDQGWASGLTRQGLEYEVLRRMYTEAKLTPEEAQLMFVEADTIARDNLLKKQAARASGGFEAMDTATANAVRHDLFQEALLAQMRNVYGMERVDEIAMGEQKTGDMELGNRAGETAPSWDIANNIPEMIKDAAISMRRDKSPGQKSGPFVTALSHMLTGFISVPANVLNRSFYFTPVGIARAAYKLREFKNDEITSHYNETMSTRRQAEIRMLEGIIGTVLMTAYIALKAAMGGDDDDEPGWGINITGAGPKDPKIKEAWSKKGHHQNAIELETPWGFVAVPWGRGGFEGVSMMMIPMAAVGDMQLNGIDPEKAANIGHYAGAMMNAFSSQAKFFGIKSTTEGLFQTEQQAVSKIVYSASPLTPFSGLLKSLGKAFGEDSPMDQSSPTTAFWASSTVAGVAGKAKINAFGDQMGDLEWLNRAWFAGVPASFSDNRSPSNDDLYSYILREGIAPSVPVRSTLERANGTMTDERWFRYAEARGQTLKAAVRAALPRLSKMDHADAENAMEKLSADATSAAKKRLGLK